MTENKVRSLSKVEMLEILHQQELEIERLYAEIERRHSFKQAGSLAEASIALSGVMEAAQDAAEIYLKNLQAAEAEKKEMTDRMEEEARQKAGAILEEAERVHEEIMSRSRRVIAEVQSVLDWHMGRLITYRDELQDMTKSMKLTELLQDSDVDEAET